MNNVINYIAIRMIFSILLLSSIMEKVVKYFRSTPFEFEFLKYLMTQRKQVLAMQQVSATHHDHFEAVGDIIRLASRTFITDEMLCQCRPRHNDRARVCVVFSIISSRTKRTRSNDALFRALIAFVYT